jgi:hypothetical protein
MRRVELIAPVWPEASMKSLVGVRVAVIAVLLALPLAASAQDVPVPAAPSQPPAAQSQPPVAQGTAQPTPAAKPAADQPLLKAAELEALVAPIALYPDDLLSLVLMASTYPLEVVEAQRWLDANKKLTDEQRKAALAKLDWDQSVKSLVATPTVVDMMSTQLDWTRKLGDAVLAQEADVMDAIQRLRAKARTRDKLVSTRQQKVTVQNTGTRQYIAIEPVDPDVIFVPYYEPAVVYGDWPYLDYPPYFFPYPGYFASDVLAGGIWFGTGFALGYWGGGYYWGGRCNWVNNNIYYRNGGRWAHRPEHRRGVGYSNASIQRQFGDRRAGRDQLNFRGRDGRQVVRPSVDRANRAAAANRRDAALSRDARGNRAGNAATRQADRATDRARAGGRADRAAQRAGARNRAAQGQRVQGGRMARGPGRAGVGARGGPRYAARGYPGRGYAGPRYAGRGAIGPGYAARGYVGRGYAGRGYPGGGGVRGAGFRGGGAAFAGGGFRGGGGAAFRGGGGAAFRGGGGGFRGGGGGGGGGGRRSDIRLKEDFALVGRLDSGLGLYRFRYHGDPQTYVGVMAQDVQMVRPDAVLRGRDGYLRVRYERIGFDMQTYEHWRAQKAQRL